MLSAVNNVDNDYFGFDHDFSIFRMFNSNGVYWEWTDKVCLKGFGGVSDRKNPPNNAGSYGQ